MLDAPAVLTTEHLYHDATAVGFGRAADRRSDKRWQHSLTAQTPLSARDIRLPRSMTATRFVGNKSAGQLATARSTDCV